MEKRKDVLSEKSMLFAIRIVRLYQYLVAEKKEFIMSKQLLRSGTNPGAMVREAGNAESGSDFIHKLGIAQKELGETIYWLELLFATEYLTKKEFESIVKDAEEITRIVKSSILTKKRNINSNSK
ncbi:MAG: four helix bundle protein [Saprospiraceae bacterium]|jgi:four helix bundle protein